MPSIMDMHIARDEEFRRRFRTEYLATVSRSYGFVMEMDLRDMALREAVAMIELARELSFPRR
jgi:hypothetical protein